MKISFSNTIFSKEKIGGISRYFVFLIKKLIENEIDIKVVSFLHKNKLLRTLPKQYFSGFYLPNFPIFKYIDKMNIDKFNSYNKFHTINIIHDTYYTPGIQKSPGVKKVITVHDLIHEKFKDYYRNSGDLINLKKKSFEDCDYFICVSNNTKKDLIEFYDIDIDKISVVSHGVDHLIADDLKTNSLLKFPFLLYVGSRQRYKNFDFFLKGFAKAEKIKNEFKLICFGGGAFNNKEKKLINDLSIKDSVLHVSGNDNLLSNYYSQANATVIPSIYEGFGFPLLEAMRFSCPIFCSDIDVFKEICGKNAFFFNPNDEDDLIYKLENTLLDTSILKNFCSKNLLRSKNFTWDKTYLETLDIYKKIT